jgi:hypothetical protein
MPCVCDVYGPRFVHSPFWEGRGYYGPGFAHHPYWEERGYYGPRHREETIESLSEYQRELEQRAADLADEIRRLKEKASKS